MDRRTFIKGMVGAAVAAMVPLPKAKEAVAVASADFSAMEVKVMAYACEHQAGKNLLYSLAYGASPKCIMDKFENVYVALSTEEPCES